MQNYIFVFLLIISAACTPKKDISNGNNSNSKCNTIATVKDFTGLDGCRFLIVLDNGKKLLPAKSSNPNFKYSNNQKIKFGYKPLEDMVSVCMTEDMSVEITCIEEISPGSNIPIKKECAETTKGTDVKWIMEKALMHKASKILRYDFLDGFAYLFQTDTKRNPLYDCQGNLVCEVEVNIRNCTRQVNNPDNGMVIWTNGSIPVKAECVETTKPMEVSWMANKIREHRPIEIIRYGFLDGFAYLYKTDSKRSYVYDCQGNFMCDIESDIRQCTRQVNNPGKGSTIWRNSKPIKKECVETTNPMEVTWMKQRMGEHKPSSIWRYVYLDGFAYFFKTASKRSYLYDCQGNFLCEVEVSLRQCSRPVENPDNGLKVWEASN